MDKFGGALCCLAMLAGVVAFFVWIPRRTRGAIGTAIDRQVSHLGPAWHVLNGVTTGLNGRSSQATRAQLRVGPGYVAVARLSMAARTTVEVFRPEEILSVEEGDIRRTGVDGFLAQKNAATNAGRAFGLSTDAPGIVLRTRRGDVAFTVTRRYLGELRQTSLAIAALIGHPGQS